MIEVEDQIRRYAEAVARSGIAEGRVQADAGVSRARGRRVRLAPRITAAAAVIVTVAGIGVAWNGMGERDELTTRGPTTYANDMQAGKVSLSDLKATSWELVSIVENGANWASLDDAEATLSFDSASNRVVWDAGCNRYSAEVADKGGGRSEVGLVGATNVYCENRTENAFLELMVTLVPARGNDFTQDPPTAIEVSLDGDDLMVSKPDGSLQLRFRKA